MAGTNMGRFQKNDIIDLLDQHPTYNMGESTSQDLILGEILDAGVLEKLAATRLSYGSSQGDADLRREIAINLGVSPEKVVVTVGGGSALFAITFVLCGAGDEIVVATPCFPPTMGVMQAIGASIKPVRLTFDGGYRMPLDDLKNALSPRTKLVSFTTPHNPSGVVVPPGDCAAILQAMDDVCPDAYLLVDESYREAVYGDQPIPPSMADLSPRVMTNASISKCHGAPGLRIGWLSCHDPDMIEQLILAKLNTVISCSVVDELLALEVLRRKDVLFRERREGLALALDKVAAWIDQEAAFVEWVRPEGGAMCSIRLRADVFADDVVDRFFAKLKAHDTMVAQGRWFDDADRIFRLGFGYLPVAVLDDALGAVSAALRDTLK